MNTRSTQEHDLQRELEDPPVIYLRTGILVRDSARTDSAMTPEAREWSQTFSLIALAALIGSIFGLLLR